MKTYTEIAKKATHLQDELSKVKDVYENFGDKEMRELEDFIGYFYDYDCSLRLKIVTIQMNFRSWCGTFNGSPDGEN